MSQTSTRGRTVFVTVGTTKFEKLIEAIDTVEVLSELKNSNVTHINCQIGHGQYEPFMKCGRGPMYEEVINGLTLSFFRHKPSISLDLEQADIIIGHAGVGTIIEAVRANKPVLVVVNADLMDNHQLEVAEAMSNNGFVNMCYPKTLIETLCSKDVFHLLTYPPRNPRGFADMLQELCVD